LELGADIVTHSLTKYMNGHSDVVMGAIMLSDDELFKRLKFLQNAVGAVPSPFDCFMVGRGLKTLSLRMKMHMENGLKVAKALENNPRIVKLIYPGLESHPQHELYKKQMKGFGGMISIYIKGGLEEAKAVLKELKIFTLAESLGGYESLIEHPYEQS
jgi:cystathionine gamma-lyase